MSAEVAMGGDERRRELLTGSVGMVVLLVVLLAGLWWAKWMPYLAKADKLAAVRHWSGSVIFDSAGRPGAAPSLSGAWRFSSEYFVAVWKALVVALAVGAGVDALAPRRWLLSAVNRPSRGGQALAGGLMSLPCMMCTCCTAPVTVGLRRRGVSLTGALAYWWGNPLLNPAVLVFLALVLPWQFVATRVVIGAVLVFGVSTLLGRLLERRNAPEHRWVPSEGMGSVDDSASSDAEVVHLRDLPGRYLRSLTRFSLILVPEYAIVVLGLGLVSATVSDFGTWATRLGVGALVVAAVVATLLVVPTGGEIAVILAAIAAGAGAGLLGVLLIALPALSLPSMVMVGRALGWRGDCHGSDIGGPDGAGSRHPARSAALDLSPPGRSG